MALLWEERTLGRSLMTTLHRVFRLEEFGLYPEGMKGLYSWE